MKILPLLAVFGLGLVKAEDDPRYYQVPGTPYWFVLRSESTSEHRITDSEANTLINRYENEYRRNPRGTRDIIAGMALPWGANLETHADVLDDFYWSDLAPDHVRRVAQGFHDFRNNRRNPTFFNCVLRSYLGNGRWDDVMNWVFEFWRNGAPGPHRKVRRSIGSGASNPKVPSEVVA